jgi:hypothetical protein
VPGFEWLGLRQLAWARGGFFVPARHPVEGESHELLHLGCQSFLAEMRFIFWEIQAHGSRYWAWNGGPCSAGNRTGWPQGGRGWSGQADGERFAGPERWPKDGQTGRSGPEGAGRTGNRAFLGRCGERKRGRRVQGEDHGATWTEGPRGGRADRDACGWTLDGCGNWSRGDAVMGTGEDDCSISQ